MNNSTFIPREPSPMYLNITFRLLGIMQIISILLSSILILTVILHRTLRTIPNLLTVNSSFAILIYAVVIIVQLIIGLQPRDEDLCIFLSYFTSIAADAICYSYLVTAISQYFFTILFRRKYLLTFRIHWIIIAASWSISCLLPLLLYFPGVLQYSPEMHLCSLEMSFRWIIIVYMGLAIGVPFFAIIGIYRYIVRQTRRTNPITNAITISQITSNRDLRVFKHILTLTAILGTAGFPSLILVIWNAILPGQAPVPLYLICILTISFCVNIQISFIFVISKNIRVVLWNRVRLVLH